MIEQNVTIFPDISGISPIDAIRENSCSSSQRIGIAICNGYIRPGRKNILINYDRLQSLFGAGSYEQLMRSHEGWVNEYLGDGKKGREEEWTGSIAVGNRTFAEKVKELLGFRAKGRKIIKSMEGCQVWEAPAPYNVLFGVENADIENKNTYFCDINL